MDIQKLVSQLTLEEKASLCSGLDFWRTKPIDRLGIPSVMVSDGPHGLRKQNEQSDHLGINDSLKAVCFPTASATAASFDVETVHEIGLAIGDTCQHEQVSVALGPAVNIKRSPLCGRNFEYFSEDPYLTKELSTSYIKALQSKNIGASIKHFALNNQEHRRMTSDSVVDERTMREIYFPAFEDAVKRAKPWTVMSSYNHINGTYACESHELLTEILRDEWGFDGYVMSDWGATSDRVVCLQAGMDLEMPASGGVNDKRIVKAVQDGKLDEKLLDQAVERILKITYRYLDNAKPDTVWDLEAQHALARRIAADCMVLLKNEDAILPLDESDEIAVIGKFAMQPRYQGGGSSHINSFKTTSLMDVLEGHANVSYAQGYDIESEQPDEALIDEAVKLAGSKKTVIIVAGLPDQFESEGYDRAHLGMPACQNELIARVAAANPNTVVVLYNGSPVEMPWLGSVKAVLEAYLGGQAVGGATKDVLFGDVCPSGRLPESFPQKIEDTPCFLTYGGEKDHAVYNEGVFVGYRYYEKKKIAPLFPFGHGLSYTSFDYSNLSLSASSMNDTDSMTVSVDVKNIGQVAGKEVVQLYVSDKQSTVFRPIRELKGFQKILLAPGESKTVTFVLDKSAFAYWNVQLHDWHVETGEFAIQIGKNSHEMLLEDTVQVQSTVEVPEVYTVNTPFGDLMANPRAKVILAQMGSNMMGMLGTIGQEEQQVGDAAESAVSKDMLQAMLQYAPLRSAVSFSGGQMNFEQLDELLKVLNQ
ncbi:glycoside hydrolase family 3 C-terminal domain-containing protein [Eubacteriales bacterium OttesenSCG-928-N13]|nr:glycoside hydrolase family 3 C-terminal domain-containing protein [Eubacteriales bacterium OttesenSCG-928-N13]